MALRQKIFESNNKGLFDIAVGEGNISANFATELQNSRVALNGEVSKRRGRTFFNDVAIEHASGNTIDSHATSNQSGTVTVYQANNEQVGFALTLSSGESLQCIKFYLKKTGNATGVMQAKIFASSGSIGNRIPTGSALQTSIEVDASTLTSSFTMVPFWFEEPYVASAGSICILIQFKSGDASNNVVVGTDASPSHASNAYKTNTSNSNWSVDTTQDLIFDLMKAGPNVDSVMIYEGNYPGSFEVLAQADTRLLRYSSSTSAFDTVIKTGLTIDKRLNWTMFNNKMMLTNGTDNPFKYGYAPQPFKPTTSTTSSGSKNTRTYYITITYVTANGESIVSEEATQNIGANDVLIVNSPVSLSGITGWNVYHHTVSGSLKLQNTTPIAIGTSYNETTGALNDGASPPTTHTGWYVADLADNPPKGKYIFALNNRVWIAGITNEMTRFSGSGVDNEDDWSTASDYVNIDLAAVLARGDEITGLSRLGQTNSLIVGLRNHIVTYKVPAVFSDISIDKQVFNTGVISHRAMDEVGLDNFIVETEGLNSVRSELIVQGLKTKKLSDNIRDRINPLLKSVVDMDEVNVVNHKTENEFWVNIPSISRRYIYDYQIKAWMEDRDVTIYQSVRTPDNNILSAGKNGRVSREYTNSSDIDVYGDGHNNTNVNWKWETPWLWFDNISIKKMFKYFQFKGTGAAGAFNMDVMFDFDDASYKTIYLQSTLSAWDESGWDGSYWDFPDVNKVLIPMIGMGRAVRFVFSANHKADLSIAFYGVKYANAGFRAND